MALKNYNALYGLWKDAGQGIASKARLSNARTELIMIDNLLNMLVVQEKWTFPESIPELQGLNYYIGQTLQMMDCMVLFREPTTGKFLFLQATPNGFPNIYGDYEEYQAIGRNGRTFTVKAKDCAVCWNTINRTTTSGLDISETALRITDAIRTADARMINHKKPIILNMSEEQKASYNQYIKKVSENQQAIAVYDNEFMKGVQTTPNDVNFINHEIYSYINTLLNQFLNRHGINGNPESNKKERLIVDEVNSNNEYIMNNRAIYTTPRIEFCERAKAKFGIDIKYEFMVNNQDVTGQDTTDVKTNGAQTAEQNQAGEE